MSKLNIYRALVLIGLAAICCRWNLAFVLIAAWWGFALMGALARKLDPSGESPYSRIANRDVLGALDAWLGLWNGFYVWKDLDHDYWARMKAEAAAAEGSKRDTVARNLPDVEDN